MDKLPSTSKPKGAKGICPCCPKKCPDKKENQGDSNKEVLRLIDKENSKKIIFTPSLKKISTGLDLDTDDSFSVNESTPNIQIMAIDEFKKAEELLTGTENKTLEKVQHANSVEGAQAHDKNEILLKELTKQVQLSKELDKHLIKQKQRQKVCCCKPVDQALFNLYHLRPCKTILKNCKCSNSSQTSPSNELKSSSHSELNTDTTTEPSEKFIEDSSDEMSLESACVACCNTSTQTTCGDETDDTDIDGALYTSDDTNDNDVIRKGSGLSGNHTSATQTVAQNIKMQDNKSRRFSKQCTIADCACKNASRISTKIGDDAPIPTFSNASTLTTKTPTNGSLTELETEDIIDEHPEPFDYSKISTNSSISAERQLCPCRAPSSLPDSPPPSPASSPPPSPQPSPISSPPHSSSRSPTHSTPHATTVLKPTLNESKLESSFNSVLSTVENSELSIATTPVARKSSRGKSHESSPRPSQQTNKHNRKCLCVVDKLPTESLKPPEEKHPSPPTPKRHSRLSSDSPKISNEEVGKPSLLPTKSPRSTNARNTSKVSRSVDNNLISKPTTPKRDKSRRYSKEPTAHPETPPKPNRTRTSSQEKEKPATPPHNKRSSSATKPLNRSISNNNNNQPQPPCTCLKQKNQKDHVLDDPRAVPCTSRDSGKPSKSKNDSTSSSDSDDELCQAFKPKKKSKSHAKTKSTSSQSTPPVYHCSQEATQTSTSQFEAPCKKNQKTETVLYDDGLNEPGTSCHKASCKSKKVINIIVHLPDKNSSQRPSLPPEKEHDRDDRDKRKSTSDECKECNYYMADRDDSLDSLPSSSTEEDFESSDDNETTVSSHRTGEHDKADNPPSRKNSCNERQLSDSDSEKSSTYEYGVLLKKFDKKYPKAFKVTGESDDSDCSCESESDLYSSDQIDMLLLNSANQQTGVYLSWPEVNRLSNNRPREFLIRQMICSAYPFKSDNCDISDTKEVIMNAFHVQSQILKVIRTDDDKRFWKGFIMRNLEYILLFGSDNDDN